MASFVGVRVIYIYICVYIYIYIYIYIYLYIVSDKLKREYIMIIRIRASVRCDITGMMLIKCTMNVC